MDQLMPISAQPASRVNPLLSRVRLPGESFTIPSRGLLYGDGILSHDIQNGELHVYPMTAIDEVAMKSADKLFSGQAVHEVFGRCIPGILNVGKLFAKDVDYLLTALYKVSYGPTISVTFTHDCEDAKEHNYEVALDTFLRGAQSLNPLALESKFKYKVGQQTVKFKPATYDDMIALNQYNQQMDSVPEVSNEQKLAHLMYTISTTVESVDEVTDRRDIIEWLNAIAIQDLTNLANHIGDTADWGIEFNVDLTCEDCKEAITVPTTLNPVSFFI